MTKQKSFLNQVSIVFIFVSFILMFAMQIGNASANDDKQDLKIPAEIREKAENEVKTKREILTEFVHQIENKVQALAKSEFTNSYLSENSESNRKSLTQLFFYVASTNDSFMQIRFLDAQGWEKVRVDRPKNKSPIIIKGKDLQNKGKRGYFLGIAKTPVGALWHSRFDLNIERGAIEMPLNPTFRVGTPLYLDSVFKGIVIINLRLEPFLDLLRSSEGFDTYLIDQNGKYIIHPDRNQEWSRYFTERGQILEPISRDGYQKLNQKGYQNGAFVFSLSQAFQNNETIRLILAPKKEMLDYFRGIDQKKRNLQVIAKEIGLTADEVDFLNDHPTIRVHNEMDWPPFNFNENGIPKGLSIDYMNLLAEKSGIHIKYISGYSWSEFIGMLKIKEIDVICNMIKTKERLEYALFTEPFIENPNVIVSQSKNKYQTLEELYGKTVAFPKGFFYEEVLKNEYPQIKRLPVNDSFAGLKAVLSGKADAALEENVVVKYLSNKHFLSDLAVSGEVKIGPPDMIKLRLGIRKDWPLLRSILNKTMKKISAQEMIELRKKWFSSHASVSKKVSLTLEEQKWLLTHSTVRLGDDFSWPPFSFLDSAGRYSGISSGYVDLVSKRLGIEMIPEYDISWSQALEKVKKKEIDFLPAVAKTPEREKYLNFTKPYILHPIAISTRNDFKAVRDLSDMVGSRVGVVKDYMTEGLLAEHHPDVKMVAYNSLIDGLQALNEKQIDAFVDNLLAITWEIDHSNFENLKIAATTKYHFELAMGVRKDWPEFIPILDKALSTISTEDHTTIRNTWIAVNIEYGWDLKEILTFVIPMALLGMIITIIIILWNRRLGREVKARKALHNELTGVKQMLDIALEASNTGIWQYDLTPEGAKNVYMSDQWYKQVGYTRDEFEKDQDVFDLLLHPDDKEATYQTIKDNHKNHRSIYETEFRLKAKDGTWKWIYSKGQVVDKDSNQVATRLTGAHMDITDRKKTEADLKETHDKITDSIKFASMIQNAMLPDNSLLSEFCTDSFAIWEPKDVVGGDIFFVEKLRNENELILFVIDCTGHGVPGALVTAIVKAVELQALGEVLSSKGEISPARVLTYFNVKLKYILNQQDKNSDSNAGFDGGVLYINKDQNIVKFAGAETPLFYIQDGKINMIKGDRQSIGYKKSDAYFQFKDHTIEVDQETCIYLVTDGFLDQNGGAKGYPYGKKKFQQLLLDKHHLDFAEQKKIYLDAIHEYRGSEDTTDDMTFVGLKVK
jgi:PAS domain S-box-containing protein